MSNLQQGTLSDELVPDVVLPPTEPIDVLAIMAAQAERSRSASFSDS